MEFKSVNEAKEYYEKEIRRVKHIMRFQTVAMVFVIVVFVVTGWLGV